MNIIGWNAQTSNSPGTGTEARLKLWQDRLVNLVKERFNGDLEVLDISTSTEGLQAGSWHESAGRWHRLVPTNNGPVYLRYSSANANHEELSQIEDLVELVGAMRANIQRLADLQRFEVHLLHQRDGGQVIQLNSARQEDGVGASLSSNRFLFDFRMPCLVEGLNYLDITKMALEIHEHCRRTAFVYFHELDSQARCSSSELSELSGSSLFIPDVCLLTSKEQAALLELLTQGVRVQGPHILVGSVIPFGELLTRRLVNADLLRRLAVAHLRMTKPFHIYQREGVLEFFLTSLTSR